MRALCDSCSQPQPVDWRPGDLCVHCGLPARQQTRCYWCTHWMPAGNFCRHCGAEAIATADYAPARMLKFYGADMFAIPKMLRDMDPARLETFRSLYGKHLAVATRHVEELRELEKDLFQQCWSGPLEAELIPQLPWPEPDLAHYANPELRGRQSPFPFICSLATLVALRHGDFSLLSEAGSMLCGSDREISLEAALQIANWRVAGNTYLERLRYPVMDCLRTAAPRTLLVQLSLAYLGEPDTAAPTDALASDDPEIKFFAALLLGDERTLVRALASPNPLQRAVAANKLIDLDRAGHVVDLFTHRSDSSQQLDMLRAIHRAKHPVPALHAPLFQTISQNPASQLARMAATAICLGCSQPEAVQLAESLDWDILHALALSRCVTPETYRAIGLLLVQQSKVAMSQYFWTCVAEPPRMPQDFVELAFPFAHTPLTQIELLRFAEKQLDHLQEIPRGTSMERVLIKAAFDDLPADVIGAAWACLHRINYRREYGSPSPFPYAAETIRQFWSLEDFEHRLERLQSNAAALEQTFVAEELGRFLASGGA